MRKLTMQELFSAISGFEFDRPYSSAKDDIYYELLDGGADIKERIQHLDDYCFNVYEDCLTQDEYSRVDSALIEARNFSGSGDKWDQIFIDLEL